MKKIFPSPFPVDVNYLADVKTRWVSFIYFMALQNVPCCVDTSKRNAPHAARIFSKALETHLKEIRAGEEISVQSIEE